MRFRWNLNVSVQLSFSSGSPCLFWKAYFTQERWQQVSCHNKGGENTWKEPTGPEILRFLKCCYCMSFDSDVTLLWPLPKQKTWYVLLCDRLHVFHNTSSLQSPDSSLCIQRIFHPSSFLSPFLAIFSNIIHLKSLHSQLCLPSVLSVPSLPLSIKTHFLCTTCIMTDWWLPPQYLSVIMKSLALVPKNLQSLFTHRLQILLWQL